jgi:hypothetical protein
LMAVMPEQPAPMTQTRIFIHFFGKKPRTSRLPLSTFQPSTFQLNITF